MTYVQASPWIAISDKQVELMARLIAEIGFTPSARSRLAISMRTGPKPWEYGGRDARIDKIERIIVRIGDPDAEPGNPECPVTVTE